MTTLTTNPLSSDQETAVRMFLDALHIEYKTNEDTDDTTYLLSSTANAKHLKKSIEQGQKGEVIGLHPDEIWKL
jgi:hypothetical protein